MAGRGNSVAVVEEGRLGGTCLNRGCIPSKQLLYHADMLETVERVDEAVADAGLVTLDEYDGHPSIRSLDDDYEIVTF